MRLIKNRNKKVNKNNENAFLFSPTSLLDSLLKILEKEQKDECEQEIEEILDKLIKTRNGTYILNAGRALNGRFADKIGNALIQLDEPLFLYGFAKNVKNANIVQIEDEIIKMQDFYYYVRFVEEVQGANVEKFENALISAGDYHALAYFANNTTKASILRIEDGLIKNKNIACICGFARLVENVDVQKLENAVIDYGCASYMVTFAKEVKNAHIERLEREVIKAGSPASSLRWINTFNTENFNEHLEIIVDRGTFSQCYAVYNQFYDCLAPSKKELLMFALNVKAQNHFELMQLSNVKKDQKSKNNLLIK